MKKPLLSCALAVAGVLMIVPVLAHDPAEHAPTAEAPDCEAMKTMDHSNRDMNDPVMQALMKKCSATSVGVDAHEGMDQGDGMNHEGMDESTPASSESREGHPTH